ncbi:MAG: restriction endonuclease subunit S, partial [Verrucomicrobiota bacterium]
MKLETFFEKFEMFADAPNAVAKMRELVLTLAAQGKLVDQNPEDEPASKLIEQIEKQDSKTYQKFDKESVPYQAPPSWIWVKLGFLAEIERGGSPRPIKDYITNDPEGLNWIKIGDTEKGGRYITSTQEKIRKEGLKKTRRVYPGDFLLTNSMSFGRPYITKIEGCIHDGWLRIHPPRQITPEYLYHLLSSSSVYTFFCKSAAGAVVQNLNADKVRELPIPLPPHAEQKRIVAKVDELMALCDRLEGQQQEREEKHKALSRASLARFADAPTPANLQFVFHPSYTISPPDLRKSILTLAVQGKLVPQDPEDEPAEDLLARLVRELTPEQSRSQAAPLPLPPAESFQYEVPESWTWARFRSVAIIASNLVKPDEFLDFTHLAPDNIEKGNGVLLPCRTVREDKVISSNHRFYPGQIVYSKIRPNLAKVVVVDFEGLCSADMYPIDALIDTFYLQRYMLSESFLVQAVKMDTRVAMPKINQMELNAISVPIPPL